MREQILKSFKDRVYAEMGYHKEIFLPEEEILIEIATNAMQYYQREINAMQDQLNAELNDRINFKNMMDDLVLENEELKRALKKKKNDWD